MADDDFDEEYDDDESGSKALKQLRAQNRKLANQLKEQGEVAAAALKRARTADLRDVLDEMKAPAKLAKLYTNEDTSPEAVKGWLKENADVFHLNDEDVSEEDEADWKAVGRSQSAGRGNSGDDNGAEAPGNVEERLRLMRTLPLEELEKRGLMKFDGHMDILRSS